MIHFNSNLLMVEGARLSPRAKEVNLVLFSSDFSEGILMQTYVKLFLTFSTVQIPAHSTPMPFGKMTGN